MKIFTEQTKKVFSPHFGWLNEIKFKVFGFTYWTERHFPEAAPRTDEQRHNLQDLAEYMRWRDQCQLPFINNEQFNKVIEKF